MLETREGRAGPLPTRAELAACHLVLCSHQFLTAEFQRCLSSDPAPSLGEAVVSPASFFVPVGHGASLTKRGSQLTSREVEESMWGARWSQFQDVANEAHSTVDFINSDKPSPGKTLRKNRQARAEAGGEEVGTGVKATSSERAKGSTDFIPSRGPTDAVGKRMPPLDVARLVSGIGEERTGAGSFQSFRRGRSALLSIHWQRLVVDEGHALSRTTAQYVQLCRMIVADKR